MSRQARAENLRGLVETLSLPIQNIDLLDRALTHTSYANENKSGHIQHNQRLEFLGDAVLDLIVGEYLFRQYPQMTEGELTRTKAGVVCEDSLASCSAVLHFADYLLLGRGEAGTGGRTRPSILADTFEAVIGAIYVDSSYEETARFVLSHLNGYLEKVEAGSLTKDYKTLLQEYVQRDGEHQIQYLLIAEEGPDHSKTFCMEVQIDGVPHSSGRGRSKKIAEQHAAQVTLEELVSRKGA